MVVDRGSHHQPTGHTQAAEHSSGRLGCTQKYQAPHARAIHACVLYTKTMLLFGPSDHRSSCTLRACEKRLHDNVSHGVRDVPFVAGCSRLRVRPNAFPRRASAPRAGGSLSLHKQLTYFHSHDRNIRQGRYRSQAQRELRQAEGAFSLCFWLLWWCQQQYRVFAHLDGYPRDMVC